MSRKRRPAQAQRRPAMGIRRQAPVFARWRLRLTGPTNCDKCHGKVGRRKRSAARQWASGAWRLFCPVAAAPYRAYELRQMSRKGRPAQAQRRPAMNIRRQAPVFARWRLRLTGPTNCDKCHGNVGRCKRSAARQWASGARRLFCPVAAAPYRAYELRQMSRKGRPAQAQRRPAMGIRRQAPVFARWRLRLTGPTSCDKCHGNVGRRKRSAARQ
ncbi:chaperone protein DnaJ [Klebsiella pneumoniae]|nr:chaperone protein DnaJ [Klebsiella pneumoniae]